jgi:hypothetical protein
LFLKDDIFVCWYLFREFFIMTFLYNTYVL